MKFARTRKAAMGLDMSPLIDCVFLLLVFFLLSSSFLGPVVRVALPRASQDEEPPLAAVLVTATTDGRLYVGGEEVEAEALAERLRQALADSPARTVTFRGDRNIPYHRFVEVMDAARRAGALDFVIAHEPEQRSGREIER